jgi:predicted nucleic acid-binding protein
MPGEVVLDASVAVKVFITEEGSDEAREFVLSGIRLVAPELILVELAHVAVKRLRRGDIARSLADSMVSSAASLLHELVPTVEVVARAFALAADHGFSAYDALYLALAEARDCDLVTADLRLIARASQESLGVRVRVP